MSDDRIDDIDDVVVTGRTWEDAEPWVEPVHKEPLVRARPIVFAVTDRTKATKRYPSRIKAITASEPMPDAALAFAKAFIELPGWTLKANYALGWEMNSDGTTKRTAIKELTGEMTAGSEKTPPRPATRTVGWLDRDPVPSVMMLAHAMRAEGRIALQALWVADAFEEARVWAPPGVPFALIGARQLGKWVTSAPGIDVI